jgi:hypothetical protein
MKNLVTLLFLSLVSAGSVSAAGNKAPAKVEAPAQAEAAAAAPAPAKPVPSPELDQARALVRVVRAQRDLNSQQAHDLQAQLELAFAEIADLKRKLAAATTPKPEAKPEAK